MRSRALFHFRVCGVISGGVYIYLGEGNEYPLKKIFQKEQFIFFLLSCT